MIVWVVAFGKAYCWLVEKLACGFIFNIFLVYMYTKS
jgi:hypothetical protein